MAAPALITTGVEQAGAVAKTYSLTAPTRAVGDGLFVATWNEGTTATVTVAPSGYELWATISKTNFTMRWWKRIATNTSADNFAMTISAEVFRFAGMRRITGNTTNLAEWVLGTTGSGSSTEVKCLALKPTVSQSLMLGLYNTSIETTVSTVTSGWTKSFLGTVAPLYWKEHATGGTEEPNLVVKMTGSSNWVGVMAAVPPPPVAAGSPIRMLL